MVIVLVHFLRISASLVLAAAALVLAGVPALAYPAIEAPRARPAPAGPLFAQRGGPVSEQAMALQRREQGHILPLETIIARARQIGRGEYLGVEPELSSNIYRVKFMRPDGRVVWVDVDGRTGRVLSERR
jgi:hypothetical protein